MAMGATFGCSGAASSFLQPATQARAATPTTTNNPERPIAILLCASALRVCRARDAHGGYAGRSRWFQQSAASPAGRVTTSGEPGGGEPGRRAALPCGMVPGPALGVIDALLSART